MKPSQSPSDRAPRPTSTEPPRPAPSPDPFGNRKPKEPLIKRIGALIETVFSHKGSFAIGVAVAVISISANVWFYRNLLTAGGVSMVGAIVGAILISFGTTIFELIPSVQKASPRLTYYDLARSAAQPNRIPDAKDPRLVEDHRNANRKNEEFFKAMRIFAYAVEGFIAVIFLGNIGTGIRAMLRLLLFVGSLLGCEWGVRLALRSAERELSVEARQAADAELRNSARNYRFRQLS